MLKKKQTLYKTILVYVFIYIFVYHDAEYEMTQRKTINNYLTRILDAYAESVGHDNGFN